MGRVINISRVIRKSLWIHQCSQPDKFETKPNYGTKLIIIWKVKEKIKVCLDQIFTFPFPFPHDFLNRNYYKSSFNFCNIMVIGASENKEILIIFKNIFPRKYPELSEINHVKVNPSHKFSLYIVNYKIKNCMNYINLML